MSPYMSRVMTLSINYDKGNFTFPLFKASEMIKTIRQAFERNIPKADWMDDSTKEKALEKVRSDNCDLVNDHTT